MTMGLIAFLVQVSGTLLQTDHRKDLPNYFIQVISAEKVEGIAVRDLPSAWHAAGLEKDDPTQNQRNEPKTRRIAGIETA